MAGTEPDFAAVTSELLGTGANPSVAAAIVNWEMANLAQYGVGYAVAVGLATPVAAAVVAGMAAAWGTSQITDYLGSVFSEINQELGAQANLMNAINLDGLGLNMPDPVSGMGYYQ